MGKLCILTGNSAQSEERTVVSMIWQSDSRVSLSDTSSGHRPVTWHISSANPCSEPCCYAWTSNPTNAAETTCMELQLHPLPQTITGLTATTSDQVYRHLALFLFLTVQFSRVIPGQIGSFKIKLFRAAAAQGSTDWVTFLLPNQQCKITKGHHADIYYAVYTCSDNYPCHNAL